MEKAATSWLFDSAGHVLDTGLKVMCGDLAPSGTQVALGCEDGQVCFAAVEGFENASIVVTATQSLKPTASFLGRLMGKTKLTRTYRYTCPVCRQSVETAQLPRQLVSCSKCRRSLRVNAREALLA
jgi:hypothetical protein